MPRIVPIQLLKCLKVLLDDNGGILSAGEVKRIASLMTKYSKKLVSKCIYVQILKCTKTELLGEFMGAGGWSLVYTWLNDAIRAMNWPLVQEILELLLLCPVDVHRLKINSAPKLVKGLCKDGGNEGVRILAKRLVEQWLKIVTDNPESSASKTPASTQIANQNQSVNKAMTPQQSSLVKTSTTAAITPVDISVSVTQSSATVNSAPLTTNTTSGCLTNVTTTTQPETKQSGAENMQQVQDEKQINNKEKAQQRDEQKEESQVEQDPLGEVQDVTPTSTSYTLTPAQKKASESGLVYKIVVKDGQQVLAKVAKPVVPVVKLSASAIAAAISSARDKEKSANDSLGKEGEDTEDGEGTNSINDSNAAADVEEDDNSSSLDKTEKESENNSSTEEEIDTMKNKHKSSTEADKKNDDKKSEGEKEKSGSASRKEHRRSKDSKDVKERRSSSSGIEKDKEKDKDGRSKSSSSSGHKSSSHKSSSSKSSSSSSSSKSKSSSSSHRSSSDKHRSDKDRSSSNKEKEKDRSSGSSSSSSSKHKSSSKSSSSSSYSSSTKDKHRDKEREKSSSSSSVSSSSANKSKDKERSDKDTNQIEKDRTASNHEKSSSNISTSPSIDKLGRIPKKPKDDASASASDESQTKPTSITIPFKKASISIEIRRDSEKAKTVKTYKSQFRSHGLTEEAPPPPSRKGLKKPSFGAHTPGTILPTSLPSSLKRSSPTPRDSPGEKRSKIDLNNVTLANEKPGAIKLIPPKKIQTLVETNLFSDALSAATGPKKVTKRKRPLTPSSASTGTAASSCNKEGPSPSTSPDLSKVVSLKFYQDTLDESKTEDSKSDKENESDSISKENCEDSSLDKDIEDDDDIPLKKVKEDIEQKVAKERKLDVDGNIIDLSETEDLNRGKEGSPNENSSNEVVIVVEDEPSGVRKPGPGCGPNGPPGVLMLHRRKGPKKKLSWSPQETLEQIRYFELDETERVNVTKTSFMDMKNLERFNERDAIIMSRRGFQREDNMEAQTTWKPLIEVEDVPHHPDGSQSKQRKIQAEREMTTLRALYFSHAIIPDSPAEAEIEPVFAYDVPVIPLDDLTGNPDAVNDFTSMPWPEPKGSPKQGDNSMSGTGGLGSPVDMFAGPVPAVIPANTNNPFNPFLSPFGNSGGQAPQQMPLQNGPQSPWQNPTNAMGPMGPGNGPLLGNPFNGHSSPTMDMGGPGMGPVPMVNNGPPQNFLGQFGPNGSPFGAPPGSQFGPPNNAMFNGPPKNFGPMGPMPLMGPNMNMLNNNGPMMNGPNQRLGNNRNNGGNGNWRTGGSNFQDNNSGNNWRPNISNRGNSGGGNNSNNGVCKAFMRGHCHLGKSCKYIHPKRKRI
ncbi:serine/threonine-protein phosphatase 1 regulatory subunit 10 [Glossina fuscipes]|uniref:Serine/threonine-protein phosphatase 1 regulatory subunit 10 n=1 Tax=Glossina fuscipes TaxID=7396 RepID=A0A8U0WL38_9MUSC|nr:serine/threonine-protein phosphatase 1 regulatory subunit 10 [Glossina fuscipes]XP_037885862.1 serine/threonine-protein phosphatase 1 regulatory subunit 10 [Glossina fuscipes]KAI9584080.1 hypothetical protein GQX74_010415 [Glossina fuscipes]